jgi:hypothetical protein
MGGIPAMLNRTSTCGRSPVPELGKSLEVRGPTELNAYTATHCPLIDVATAFDLPELIERRCTQCTGSPWQPLQTLAKPCGMRDMKSGARQRRSNLI